MVFRFQAVSGVSECEFSGQAFRTPVSLPASNGRHHSSITGRITLPSSRLTGMTAGPGLIAGNLLLDYRVDLTAQRIGRKRLDYVIADTRFYRFDHVFFVGFSRNHQKWNCLH